MRRSSFARSVSPAFAPSTAGDYEFRYFLDNGWTKVATSNPVTVSSVTPTYTVTASPSTVSAGGAITVAWTAPGGSSSLDWIGMYATGTGDGSYLSWVYTGGTTSGSAGFTAPSTAGTYEFRYFLNDGFTKVSTSNPVTVQ